MNKPYIKKAYVTLIVAVLFFAVSMPFRMFFSVHAVTEVRPAAALPPALGLMLGLPGALGSALGNLAADILSGYGLFINIAGFFTQLWFGLLPVFLWRGIKYLDKNTPSLIRLNNVKNVVRYILIIVVNALIMAALLGLVMEIAGIGAFWSTATLMLVFNNIVFGIVIGIPIIIGMTIHRLKTAKGSLSLNERVVLNFLAVSIIFAGLMGFFVYTELSQLIDDPLLMWNRIYMYITANFFIFYIITVSFLWYSEKNITIPIEAVSKIATEYVSVSGEKKDSPTVIAQCEALMHNRNEIGFLAEAFKTMVVDLDSYIRHLTTVTADRERISAELNVATGIQADMLPRSFPAFPHRTEFDIHAVMHPAKEVGGDFYDFFLIDDDHLCVVIADVSGKGVPAALFMVIAKTLINNRTRNGEAPHEVFANVNNQLCENNENAMFVTAWMGILNISTGTMTCVNAGHNPPVLKKAGSPFTCLEMKKSVMLACMEGFAYTSFEIQMEPGDTLFLYTDGVTEAHNAQTELYGEERLLEALNKIKGSAPAHLLDYVKSDIDAFAGDVEQFDDITMLGLKVG